MMKRFFSYFLAVCTLLTIAFVTPAVAAEQHNGYTNYTFETGMPEGVLTYHCSASISSQGIAGNAMAAVKTDGAPSVSLPVQVCPETVYNISVWVQSENGITIALGNAEATITKTVNGENGWKQYTATVTTGADSNNPYVTILAQDSFLLDDVFVLSEQYRNVAISGNLVSNGDFETDTAGWRASCKIEHINDGANGSDKALASTVTSNFACASTDVDIRFGRKYKMTWYAKAISEEAVGLDMKYIFDRSGTRTDNRTPLYSEHVVGSLTADWQKFEVEHQDIHTTPDRCLARLYFRAGSGKELVTFAIDEIVIEEIEDSYEVPTQPVLTGDYILQEKLTATIQKQGSAVGVYYRFLKPVGEGFAQIGSGYTEEDEIAFTLPDGYTGVCRMEINAVDTYGIVGKTFYTSWTPRGESAKEERIITNILEEIWTKDTKHLTAEAVCKGEGNKKTLLATLAVYDDRGALHRLAIEKLENVAGNRVTVSVDVDENDCNAKFMLLEEGSFAPLKQEDILTKTASEYVVYVDNGIGHDYQKGTSAEPVKTVTGAKVRLRELANTATDDIYIVFREGEYFIEEEMKLTPSDLPETVHVHFVAEKTGKTVFTGGKTAENFTLWDTEKNIYRTYVGTDIRTRQLFVNDIRATRARSAGKLENAVNLGREGVGFITTDMSLLQYSDVKNLEFVFFEEWTNSYVSADSVTDNGDGTVTVAMEPLGWQYQWNKGNCFPSVPEYIENALELLDEDGEWYLDERNGYLYYKPRVFENMETACVVMPVCEKMVSVKGTSAFEPVKNVTFRGISFENTTWNQPSEAGGFCCGQNNGYPNGEEQFIPGAIHVDNAHNVNFIHCGFKRLGMTGLKMTGGLKNCNIIGNEFYDISGGALVVGDVSKNRDYDPVNSAYFVENIDVSNNYMHKIAVDYKGGAALSTGFPQNSKLEHNEIYDTCYSGMHLGWGWNSYPTSVTENFKVRKNYIHKVMNTKIYDGGGVYFLGATKGNNEFSENYLYDDGNCYGMIYPDNGSTNWDILSNVVDLNKNPLWYRKLEKGIDDPVMPARWLHIHMSTITDIYMDNNYTTSANALNNGITNVVLKNLHVYPDARWPEEAQNIILESGIETPYQDRFKIGLQEVDVAEEIVIKQGEKQTLPVYIQTAKEKLYHDANYEIYTVSSHEAVVSVNGLELNGKAKGEAVVTLYVKEADVLNTKKIKVIVE